MNSMQITTQFSPRLDLPYRYLLTGLVFLFTGLLYLFMHPESLTGQYIRSKDVLLLVHIFGLGFITTIMMGTMYQLLSVVLESKLFSERLGRLNYYLYLSGILLFLFSFYLKFKYLNFAGVILALSLVVFVSNSVLTIARARRIDIVVFHIIAGVLSLFIIAVFGALMSQNLLKNFILDPFSLIRSHLAFALFGWVILTTMGFSYRLIPMFTLSHGYSDVYSKISFYMLSPGIFGFGFAQFFERSKIVDSIFVIIIFTGVMFYLIQMYKIINKRMRKRLEPQILATIFAEVMLFCGLLVGILSFSGIAGFTSHFSFVILLLLGFAGLYIVGLIHKIVPFLQWYNKYSPKIGIEKVPLTKEMIDESLIDTTVYFWLGGVITLAIASWLSSMLAVQFSALALLFSSVLLIWNILNVFKK